MKFDLIEDRSCKPPELPQFPTAMQAVVWRNWGIVPVERIAGALIASKENIIELAEGMGLRMAADKTDQWLKHGYITIIRRNWHLLPYDQLLKLLGWTSERFDYALKEDDFLYVKLGFSKPDTPAVVYQPLTEAQKAETAKIREMVDRYFPDICEEPEEAPFGFLQQFTAGENSRRGAFPAPKQNQIFIDGSWNISYPSMLRHVGAFVDRFVSTHENRWGIKLSASTRPSNGKNICLEIRPEAGLLPESHTLDVHTDCIRVTAVDENGLLRGLLRLESMMGRQGGPFLEELSARYDTRFDLRLIYSYSAIYGDPLLEGENDPYPEELLLRLSKLGINGIWLQGILYSLVLSADMPGLSEGWEKRITALRKLIEKAADYGIGVYLYLNEPRAMPDRCFTMHPEWKGIVNDGLTSLCTSVDGVKESLCGSVSKLFMEAPGLAGVFTITKSENFTNCYSRAGHVTTCPRCSKRLQPEVIAEVNNLIAEGAHSVNPDARVIAWTWAWEEQWAKDAITRLKDGINLMCTSEEGIPTEIAGVRGEVLDYSMSIIGPGRRAVSNWQAAAERGLGTVAKIQINNTWECSAVPYIPVMNNVKQHLQNLKSAGVNGLMLSWTLGGYPSANLELAYESYWENGSYMEDIAKTVAERLYGENTAPIVMQAWSAFDSSFKEFPFNIGVIYTAPMNCGPMNLLYEKPTGYKATMVCYPYDDLASWRAIYPEDVFEEQFRKLSEGWKRGLDILVGAAAGVANEYIEALKELERVAGAVYCHFRSTYLQIRFVRIRNMLEQSLPGNETGKAIEDIVSILNEEIRLAVMLYGIINEDSRIGFEASNHYAYTRQDFVEKVLNCEYLKERFMNRLFGGGIHA